MTIVHRGTNLAEAHRIRELLEEHGIAARVDQELVSSGEGALPLDMTSLSVVRIGDASRREEAMGILAAQARPEEGEAWRCAVCGTVHEAAFTACWNCGCERP